MEYRPRPKFPRCVRPHTATIAHRSRRRLLLRIPTPLGGNFVCRPCSSLFNPGKSSRRKKRRSKRAKRKRKGKLRSKKNHPLRIVPISFKTPPTIHRSHLKSGYVAESSKFKKKDFSKNKKKKKRKKKKTRRRAVNPFWGHTTSLRLDSIVECENVNKRKYSSIVDSPRDPLKVTWKTLQGYYEGIRKHVHDTSEFLRRISRPRNEREVHILKDVIDEFEEKPVELDEDSKSPFAPKMFK